MRILQFVFEPFSAPIHDVFWMFCIDHELTVAAH